MSRHNNRRLEGLIELFADWYWEQDAAFCFTRFEGRNRASRDFSFTDAIGKRLWETDFEVIEDGRGEPHRDLLEAHQPFHDIVIHRLLPDLTRCYISLSGEPFFDGRGRFIGYRGIGRDVTQWQKRDEELMEFRSIMDVSQDLIYIVDRTTMRFIYINGTAEALSGFPREEYLEIPPYDLLMVSREELERAYDEAIAAGSQGTIVHMRGRRREGP